jgi:UDP-glucose 4-epimerase
MKRKVLVTGASGYIGGQTMLSLLDDGHEVLAIDYRPLPEHLKVLPGPVQFMQNDFAAPASLEWIIRSQPEVIIHCAGTSLVGPSLENPAEYYSNNVMKSLTLLNTMQAYLPDTRIIFSSSASVYGNPIMNPCQEVDPCEPISPYGESKRIIEQMMVAYHNAYGLNFVALRYFNACGADSQGRHGQEAEATHIIARVLESVRDDQVFTLYGDKYPTADGTCIRDYLHVEDIARAHIMAMENSFPAGVYNLGTSHGVSNREIISLAEEVTGKKVNIAIGEPRLGDPSILTANDDKFTALVGDWKKFKVRDMISHAWTWYNK